MLLQQTTEKLSSMKLHGMLKSLEERLKRTDHQDLSFTDFLGLLVDDEWTYRENRKISLRLNGAKFKERNACIEDLEYKANRGLKKSQVLELAQNRFISAHQNVLITGPSGAGKSYLAQAFGNHACRSGYAAHYIRVPKLMVAFTEARAAGTYSNLLKRLLKIDLLILDDFGIGPLSERETLDLVELAEERYSSRSTMITSQLPVAGWHEYLGGGRIADAFLDRIVHNAHRFDIQSVESKRKEKSNLTEGGQSEK